jgi:hypothetical protein
VFFDSDVMIAGSASASGASFALLHLAELGLIKGYVSARAAPCDRASFGAQTFFLTNYFF